MPDRPSAAPADRPAAHEPARPPTNPAAMSLRSLTTTRRQPQRAWAGLSTRTRPSAALFPGLPLLARRRVSRRPHVVSAVLCQAEELRLAVLDNSRRHVLPGRAVPVQGAAVAHGPDVSIADGKSLVDPADLRRLGLLPATPVATEDHSGKRPASSLPHDPIGSHHDSRPPQPAESRDRDILAPPLGHSHPVSPSSSQPPIPCAWLPGPGPAKPIATAAGCCTRWATPAAERTAQTDGPDAAPQGASRWPRAAGGSRPAASSRGTRPRCRSRR